ncbi:MAG: GNAT family N-acetyltransferase [Pseudomonadota bacterium]
MTTIRLAALTPGNLTLLTRIPDPDIFDGAITPEAAGRLAAAPLHRVILAVADEGVVGQAVGMVQRQLCGPDALFVDNLGVARHHRRRGIASALWRGLCDWGRGEGARAVWVATERGCVEAQHLYSALNLSEGRAITFDGDL